MADTDYNGTLQQFVTDVATGIKIAKHMGDGEQLTIYPSEFKGVISGLHDTSDVIIPFDLNTKKTNYILTGYSAYAAGGKLIGAMPNRGAQTPDVLDPGETYLIPEGYHNGEGKVTMRDLVTSEGVITLNKDTDWSEGYVIITPNTGDDGLSSVKVKYDDDKTKTTYTVTENDVDNPQDISGYDTLAVNGVAQAPTNISIVNGASNNQISITATNNQLPGYFSNSVGTSDAATLTLELNYNQLKAIIKDDDGTQYAYQDIASGVLGAPSLSYDATQNKIIAKSTVLKNGYLTISATSSESTMDAVERAATTISTSYEDESKFQITAINSQGTGYVIANSTKDSATKYIVGDIDGSGNYVLKEENGSQILHTIAAAPEVTISAESSQITIPSGYVAKEYPVNLTSVDRAQTTITPYRGDNYFRFKAVNEQKTGYVIEDNEKDIDEITTTLTIKNNENNDKKIRAVLSNNKNDLIIDQDVVDIVDRAETTITSIKNVSDNTIVIIASNDQSSGYVEGSDETKDRTISISSDGATVTATDGTHKISEIIPNAEYDTSLSFDGYADFYISKDNISISEVSSSDSYDFSIDGDVTLYGSGLVTLKNKGYLSSNIKLPGDTQYTQIETRYFTIARGTLGKPEIYINHQTGTISATTTITQGGYLSTGEYNNNTVFLDTYSGGDIFPSTTDETLYAGTYLTGDVIFKKCEGNQEITQPDSQMDVVGKATASVASSSISSVAPNMVRNDLDGYIEAIAIVDTAGWIEDGKTISTDNITFIVESSGQTVSYDSSLSYNGLYYFDNVTITAPTLEYVTPGNATKNDILETKIAWVNGNKIEGSMANNTGWSTTISPGDSIAVPEGYHDGEGTIAAEAISSTNKPDTTISASSSDNTLILTASNPKVEGYDYVTNEEKSDDSLSVFLEASNTENKVYLKTRKGTTTTSYEAVVYTGVQNASDISVAPELYIPQDEYQGYIQARLNIGTSGWINEGSYLDSDNGKLFTIITDNEDISYGSSLIYNGLYYFNGDIKITGLPANLETKTDITPSTIDQTITPSEGYDGLSSVQINAIPTVKRAETTISASYDHGSCFQVNASNNQAKGYTEGGVKDTSIDVYAKTENNIFKICAGSYYNQPSEDEMLTWEIDPSAIVEGQNIMGVNGTYTGSDPNLQPKTVSSLGYQTKTIVPDTGYDGLSQVTISATATAKPETSFSSSIVNNILTLTASNPYKEGYNYVTNVGKSTSTNLSLNISGSTATLLRDGSSTGVSASMPMAQMSSNPWNWSLNGGELKSTYSITSSGYIALGDRSDTYDLSAQVNAGIIKSGETLFGVTGTYTGNNTQHTVTIYNSSNSTIYVIPSNEDSGYQINSHFSQSFYVSSNVTFNIS